MKALESEVFWLPYTLVHFALPWGGPSLSVGFVLGDSGSLAGEMVLPCSAGRVSFEQLVPEKTQISYSSGPGGIHGL